MNVQQKEVIEALLKLNPMPELDEKELAARIFEAECHYKGDYVGLSVHEPYKQFAMNFDHVTDLCNQIKNLYEEGYTHETTGGHVLRVLNGSGYIIMIKPAKMQKLELKNLTKTITTQYEAEVKKAQESHLQTLLSNASKEAAQRETQQREAELAALQESMIQSFMSK
ncbi:hypothetical protein [Photobacterium phosphoreum]|uniref:hypothetical protein n=1 Tax=Photobacterium phosphoreum TaxID=659 RepID=UPI000D15625E|nr:hypothetical protein [Photobacterium phosphoreum]PSU73705.1 hypothetical protein CTM67_19650 [Photobacterium phosphoreum]